MRPFSETLQEHLDAIRARNIARFTATSSRSESGDMGFALLDVRYRENGSWRFLYDQNTPHEG